MHHRVILIKAFTKKPEEVREKIIESLTHEVEKFNQKKTQIQHDAESSSGMDSDNNLECLNKFRSEVEGITSFHPISYNLFRIGLYSDIIEEGFTPQRKRYSPHRTIVEIPRALEENCLLCIREGKGILFLPTNVPDKIESVLLRLLQHILFIGNYEELRLNDDSFLELKDKIEMLTAHEPSLAEVSIVTRSDEEDNPIYHLKPTNPYDRRTYDEITKKYIFSFLKMKMSLKVKHNNGVLPVSFTFRNRSIELVSTSLPDKKHQNLDVSYNLLTDLFLQ